MPMFALKEVKLSNLIKNTYQSISLGKSISEQKLNF